MTAIVGRGVRVEIGITEAAAKVVSAVSLGTPGIATSTAHGLANKSIGYFSGVAGMVNMEGQAARVANQAANTFELEDIDTSTYPAFTSGNFIPITAWATLGTITGYAIGGGEGDKLDNTVLLDDIKQELQGLLSAQSVSFNLNALTVSDAGMTKLRQTARRAGYLVFRITLKTGDVRVFRGQPSLYGEDVQRGAIGTGSFAVTISGFVTEGAA